MEGNNNQENNEEEAATAEYFRSLPPGYRFNPTDRELILSYLKPRILNQPLPRNRIHTKNIYQFHPKHLTADYEKIREDEWYFFSERERKYQNGTRPNRAAEAGYWKATGSSAKIFENGEIIGHKKVLDYRIGRHPESVKTDWKMHEYTLEDEKEDIPLPKRKKGEGDMKLDVALCKIYLNTRANGNTNNNGAISTEVFDQGMVTDTGIFQVADQVQQLDSSSSNPINNSIMVTDNVTSHHHDNMLVPKQEIGQDQPLDSSLIYSQLQPQVHDNTTGGFNHVDHISNSFSTHENMSNGVYDSTNCAHYYGVSVHNGASGSAYQQWASSFSQHHHQSYYMYQEQMPSSSTSYPSNEHPSQYSSTEIWSQLQPENHEMSRADDSTLASLPPHVREYNSMLVNNKEEADEMMMPFKQEAAAADDGLQFLSIPDQNDPKTDKDA